MSLNIGNASYNYQLKLTAKSLVLSCKVFSKKVLEIKKQGDFFNCFWYSIKKNRARESERVFFLNVIQGLASECRSHIWCYDYECYDFLQNSLS